MGRSRYRVIDTRPHFVTSTTVNWLMLFSQPALAETIFSALRFLQSQQRLTIHAYVLMENHLHLIAAAADLSREMQSFKSFTAKAMIGLLQQQRSQNWLEELRSHKRPDKVESTYQVWQEGFHPQAIDSLEKMEQKLQYIHHNPVKRGYVDEACHWRYSSARNYEGRQGILDVEVITI
jgi:REP element-mobilizing transposase RayT